MKENTDMSEERNEEWELSKENIQPVQQGRKPKVLKAALTSHIEDVIEQQLQSFESEVRTYSGVDPLTVWCKYIKWVEQNFPKGGKEGHIKQLIERCLSILKDEKKYRDDDRFVDIMLKYAIISGKPIDVYAYMFSHNVGCKSAKFFINWSWELEQLGSFKKADEILIAGIQHRAEPLEKLCSYHKDFEIRLGDKIKSNFEQNCSTSENSRSTFAILKSQKKNLPPILRTGEAVIDNGKMPLVLGSQPQLKSKNSSAKVPFKVHKSENITPSLPIQLQSVISGNLNSENYKENEQRPSKWSQPKVRTHDQYLKTSNAVQPSFKFHCDEGNKQEIHTPRSVSKMSKILSAHIKTSSPPIALFEPPDPLKRPMYPKTKVYGGAEEFSLEEIRAADWFDSRKKTVHEKLLQEQQKKIEEQQKQKEQLEKKVEYLAKQVELLKSHLPNSVPTLSKSSVITELYTDINCLESVKTDKSKSNRKLKTEEIMEECYENSTMDVNSNSQSGAKSQPTHDLDYCLKNKPSSNSRSDHTFEKKDPDGTGFFEAEKMVQEFYNKTLSQSITDGECMPTSAKEFIKESSVILVTNLSNLNEANQQGEIQSSISKESSCDLLFTVYHDPTGVIADSKEIAPSKKNLEKEPNLSPNKASSEEDIENIPPKGYVQESSKRELVGILEPSKNILFIPLEEQEETDTSDTEEENYISHNVGQYTDNSFIHPSLTEQFSAAQFLSSTPNIPRDKSPILEKSEHEIESSKPNVQMVQHLSTSGPNAINREFDQDNIIRTELKSAKEQSSLPTGSKMLSVIMETSAETYSKSSSSSSASLTRSHNIDQLSSHRISMIKQCSKLEAGEPSALSSVSEVSHAISDINCQNNSEISLKKSSEICSKIQLHAVDFDPFDQEVNIKFLSSVDKSRHKNLFYSNKSMRLFKGGENVCIGNESYRIVSLVAEGAYAKVFEAVKFAMVMIVNTKKFALKVCKNSNEWEFYICNELQKRLSEKKLLPDIRNSIMNVISAEKFLNGIILVTDFGNLGTLLDTINFCKTQNSAMPELIAMYFTLEILLIVSKLHECNIIHGDIKPDNFLLKNNAFDRSAIEKLSEVTTSLQLIDFGRAVDLNFYDNGICFTSTFSTDHFKCNEMKDKRPWVFQLDWYGVASCIHTMLFSEYMMVRKKNGVWGIEKKLKRYWCTSLWDSLFNDLLNIPECYQEPNIKSHISIIESKLQQNSANFLNQVRRFSNSYGTR